MATNQATQQKNKNPEKRAIDRTGRYTSLSGHFIILHIAIQTSIRLKRICISPVQQTTDEFRQAPSWTDFQSLVFRQKFVDTRSRQA